MFRSESSHSGLADSLGEFYTNDTAVLNAIKKEWIFKKPSPQYSCGYHYNILICKNGLVVESFSINLNCNEIATDKGYFYFETRQLRMFKDSFKKPFSKEVIFSSLTEARNYRAKILKDSLLIITQTPNWTKFEGEFEFSYKCKEGTKTCMEKEDSLKIVIKSEILKAYPREDFELSDRGGSWTEIDQIISCNKSLSDKFKLFYRDTDGYFGKWKPYELSLRAYWTTEPN